MRTKEIIIDEWELVDEKASSYLFLEVLCDIRDSLEKVAKLRYAKLGNVEQVYSVEDGEENGL